MSGLPIGFMLGNVGSGDSDVEADYLDDEQRAALLKTDTDFLFTLPADLREEATAAEDEGPSGPAKSVDDDLVISESDISDGSLPEEVTQTAAAHQMEVSEDEGDTGGQEETAGVDMDIDLPILGYGENGERIFCFSKIFTSGGLKYFFEEQRREDEQKAVKAKQMAERIKRNLERQPPPLQPVDALAAWLADPETASESAASHATEGGQVCEDVMEDVEMQPVESKPRKPHLLDQKHFLKGNRVRWEDRIALNAEEGKRVWEACAAEWKSLGSSSGRVMNPHILKDDWLDRVMTSAGQQRPPSPKLIWDLNDPHMRFRMQDSSSTIDFSNAAATVLPPKEKRQKVVGPAAWPDEVFQELAFYNISKDEQYVKDGHNMAALKSRASDPPVSLNAVPALSLSTVPILYSDEEALQFHARRSDFYPPTNTSQAFINKDLPDNKLEIIFRSVTGRIATVVKPMAETPNLTIEDVYKQVQPKAFPEAKNEQPIFLLETPSIKPVEPSETFQSVLQKFELAKNIVIWIQFQSVQLVRDAVTELPSANSKLPVRPPGAFGRRKELTATDGRILLLEYLEEHPLLHFYPGMGLALQTWCPENEDKDLQTYRRQLEQQHASVKWKYGKAISVPANKSPFIGSFQEDAPVFGLESHLIRAPTCGYHPKPTDFLLACSPSGSWSLRRISGTLAVGQQQPLVKINPPLASNIKDFEERRLVSYACRKLSQQARKSGHDTKNNDTVIHVDELTNMFPVLSESVIKSRLKDKCQCIPIRGEEGSFTLKASATHRSETELRQILSPEEASAYDSCRMFKARMARLGLRHVDRLSQIPADKWKLALSLLPDRMKEIASYIQRKIQGAPWNQSEGYHAWKVGKGQVSVVGPGEPSGRGICCSFTKEHLRKSEESALPVKPQPVITGTKADLRRLGAEDAITALQKLPTEMHSMIEFEDLRKMDRWEIIRHVRAIATAAVQDGVDLSPELSKFARNPRSSVQIAVGLKRKVEQVFTKQLKLLKNEEVDTSVVPVKEKTPIRPEELPTKAGKRRVRRVVVMHDGSRREVILSMESYDHISWGGAEGGDRMEGDERIIEGRHPVAVVMEEQIVERPLMLKKPVISNRSRTIAQFGQSRIVFNKPQSKKKLKRPRTKLTKDHIWGNRYRYFERKVRLKNRKPRMDMSFFPHTVESVEQDELLKALSKPKSKRALQQAWMQQQQKRASGEPIPEEEDNYLMRQASLLSEMGLSGSLDLGSLGLDRKAKFPYKTKDGRRMTGRKVLNTKILNKIHGVLVKHPHAKHFKLQVNKTVATDYNDFVSPTDEIWLDKIGSKIRGLKYSSGQMYIEDFRKLRDNAVAYNTHGHGLYGGPQIIDFANALVQAVEEEIEKQKESIAEEEERIKSEDTEKELRRANSLQGSLPEAPPSSTAF